MSKGVVLNPKILKNLYYVFITHIETNIDRKTMFEIARFTVESKFNINFLSIPEEMLVISQNDKKYDKQYVFLPKGESWKELQEWIKSSI